MKISKLFNAVTMAALLGGMSHASQPDLQLQKMLYQIPTDQRAWNNLSGDSKCTLPASMGLIAVSTLDQYGHIIDGSFFGSSTSYRVSEPLKQYAGNLLNLLNALSNFQKEYGPDCFIELCKLADPSQLHACQRAVKSYRQGNLFPNMANNVEYRAFMGDINYTPYTGSAMLGADAAQNFAQESSSAPVDLVTLYGTDVNTPGQLLQTLWDFSAYAKNGLEMSGLAAFATGQFQKIPGSALADISQYADSRTWLELADLLSPDNTNVTQFNPNTGYDRSALYQFVQGNYNTAALVESDKYTGNAMQITDAANAHAAAAVNAAQNGNIDDAKTAADDAVIDANQAVTYASKAKASAAHAADPAEADAAADLAMEAADKAVETAHAALMTVIGEATTEAEAYAKQARQASDAAKADEAAAVKALQDGKIDDAMIAADAAVHQADQSCEYARMVKEEADYVNNENADLADQLKVLVKEATEAADEAEEAAYEAQSAVYNN